jgi:hypothetical protein
MVAPSSAASKSASPQVKKLMPPEEKFWQHYSPHHEFPWSSVISVALHGLAVFLVVVLFVRLAKEDNEDAPLPLEPIVIAGGGGNIHGVGNAPGHATPKEAENETTTEEPATTTPTEKQPKLNQVIEDPLKLPELTQKNTRTITPPNAAIQGLAALSKDARAEAFEGLAAPKGGGGTGRGGGKGSGIGTGEGEHAGAGKESTLNNRQKRTLRWTMTFNTANGEDYLRQLSALKAILAVPVPQGGAYWVFDLSHGRHHPVTKTNLNYLKRIFWVDKTTGSVRNLAGALGLQQQPPWIAAFFPVSLEQKLLKKELAYAREHTGRQDIREDNIKETQFEIQPDFEPVVVNQQVD